MTGCATPHATPQNHQTARFPAPGRSLVLDSATQRRALARLPASPGLPWYAGRNDLRPSAYAGVESPTYQASDTYTYDRLYNSGRARHYFSQTTYQRRVRVNVR